MTTAEWKDYLAKKQIPQLFESLLSGLMYYRPDDPVDYLDSCLRKVKELGGSSRVQWDTFLAQEKRTLPPLNGCQSRRSLFRNVLPDTPSFSYRRYDRLPPIHQFSIESDTDLCETAELIEEYTVFDPSKSRPWIILLIGGPGSGKGTQSLKIAKHYGFENISVGDLLRKKMIHNTTCNRKWSLIAKIITNGELAPQETTITEIKRRLMQLPDAQGFVIDGFPRDVAQVLSFEDQICTPDLVVFLACASHQLKERLEKRAAQQGRPDDNPKAIQRRLTTFKQNTIPLVKYFQERGLIVTLDADRDEEEVFYDISVAVDNKLFPTKEPVAGPSELDLSLLVDATDIVDIEPDSDEQMDNWSTTSEDTKMEENPKQAKIIFIIGGPGSGKETQCKRIAAQYGFTYISSEDILRNVVAVGPEKRRETQETVEPEELVPMEMLKDTIINSMNTKGILIEGYPQEVREAEEFEKKIGQPSLVLFLSCSSDTLEQRLRKSAQASDGDDNVSRQIEAYLSAAQPIIEKYQRENLIHKINAEETPDKVFQQISEAIRSIQGSSTSHVTLDGFL